MIQSKRNRIDQQHHQMSSFVDLASCFSLPSSCKKKRGSNRVINPQSLEVEHPATEEDKPGTWQHEFLASKEGKLGDYVRKELKDPIFAAERELSPCREDQHLENMVKKVNNVKNRCCKGDDAGKKLDKAKRRKAVKFTSLEQLGVSSLEIPADMKGFIESLRGTDVILVIVKPLYKTDLSKHHGRFTFPLKQIKNEFLTPEEKAELDQKRSLNVGFIEPCFDFNTSMRLTKWTMNRTSCYTLISGWKSVLDKKQKNDMKEGDWAQLWSFRWNGHLYFSLTLLKTANRED